MREDFGRPNYGGMAGAAVGGMGGIFALGIVPAILSHDARLVVSIRVLNLFCWLISLIIGWFIGGFIGRLLGDRFRSERAEIAGGIIGGFVPVLLLVFTGWYVWTRYTS